MKRSFMFVAIMAFLLLFIGLGVAIVYNSQLPQGHEGTRVTMRGEIVCLPYKEEVHTMECAIGFKATTGKFYALADSSYYETNTHVEITGYLIPPEADTTYNSSGTIEQAKVSKRE